MKKMMHALYNAHWTESQNLSGMEDRHNSMIARQYEIEEELMERLPQELREMFEKYRELTVETSRLPLEKEYIRGFKDGLRMMANCLNPSEED